MHSRARVIFFGKVQGVFFRAHTQRFAEENGVTGWVRNLPDGTVEAVFEGEKETVEKIIRMCHENQPYARVDCLRLEWEEPTGEFHNFRIIR